MSTNPLTASSHSGTATRSSKVAQVDPLTVLRQHAWLLSGTFISSVILGLILFIVLLFLSPQYTTQVLLRVTGGITDPYQGVQNSGQLGQTRMDLLEAYIKNQTIRLRSDDVINEVLTRDTVRQTPWFNEFDNNTVDARKDLQKRLNVSQIRGSTLINVSLTGPYEKEMVVILEEVIEEYLRKMRIETGQESDKIRMTFVRERTEAERDLARAREEMEQFASQYDLTNLESKGSEAQLTFQLLADQMTKIVMAMEEAKAGYDGLYSTQQSGQVTRTQNDLAMIEQEYAVAQRKERLRSLREQKEVLLESFGSKHRSVQDVDRQSRAIEQELNRETERLLRERQEIRLEQSKNLLDALQGQVAALAPKLDEARERMRDLNRNLQRYRQIEERALAADQRRALAEESLTRARLQSERPDSTRIQRVTPATEAELTFPKPYFVVPGVTVLLTGFVAGFVFLREMFDQRVKRPSDIKLIPNGVLLGILPDASEDPSGNVKIENTVVTDPTGLFAEAFRSIRSSILSKLDRNGYKTLMIVSAQADCGTSCVAANLAASFATNGRRVLVLDANFRRPSQHKLFNVPQQPGLAEVLTGDVNIDQAIVTAQQAGVDLLPIGNSKETTPELTEGPAFKKLLSALEKQYDLILIDVAPALLTSEARQLAKQVDAIALVVRAMNDMRGMVGRMIHQFDNHRAEVLGIILNGVLSSAGGYFKKNYEEFYKYNKQHAQNGSSKSSRTTKSISDREVWPGDELETDGERQEETLNPKL